MNERSRNVLLSTMFLAAGLTGCDFEVQEASAAGEDMAPTPVSTSIPEELLTPTKQVDSLVQDTPAVDEELDVENVSFDEQETPIATECVMPFEGAEPNLGFLDPISGPDGKQVMKDGSPIWHLGTDYSAPERKVAVSICDGKFIWGGDVPFNETGLGTVAVMEYKIEDGSVVWVIYSHLSVVNPYLKPGDIVAMGEPVGFTGKSGGWTNEHLHLQLLTEEGIEMVLRDPDNPNIGFYPENAGKNNIRKWFGNVQKFIVDRVKKTN